MPGGRSRKTLIGTTVLSILLASCEIEFTPDVVPLEIGEAPPESFTGQIPEPEQQPELQFTSADAIALCGSDLAWGDGAIGACLAPGADAYYIWADPNEVYTVPVNPTDPNQLGFLQAVIARRDSLSRMQSGAKDAGEEVATLGVEVLGLPAACAFLTIFGCALDVAAILVTGVKVANSGADFAEDLGSFDRHSRQSVYYLCMMRGLSDGQCRSQAGITSGDLEGAR